MKQILKYITLALVAEAALSSCHERYVTYDDAEYVMFADTLQTYPVQQDVEYFSIPVVSTVKRDYDRTFGVEIIDKGSNAIENVHYRLKSNTVTIKAGETRADVLVHGLYDNIEASDSLGFQLRLVMNDELEMPLYGKETKAVCTAGCIGCGICQKVCPVAAAKVENHLSRIDHALCIGCGACAAKCPVKVIEMLAKPVREGGNEIK